MHAIGIKPDGVHFEFIRVRSGRINNAMSFKGTRQQPARAAESADTQADSESQRFGVDASVQKPAISDMFPD
jgi:hypothetical protein